MNPTRMTLVLLMVLLAIGGHTHVTATFRNQCAQAHGIIIQHKDITYCVKGYEVLAWITQIR